MSTELREAIQSAMAPEEPAEVVETPAVEETPV